jgi:hypothetical protein
VRSWLLLVLAAIAAARTLPAEHAVRQAEAVRCRFPGPVATCAAPQGTLSIVWRAAEQSRPHALLVSRPDQPPMLLLEFDRWVEILWAPLGYTVAVTSHQGSSHTALWVYSGQRLEERTNLEARLASELKRSAELSRHGHRFFEAIAWHDDELRFRVRAYDASAGAEYAGAFTYSRDSGVRRENESAMYAGLIGLLAMPAHSDGPAATPSRRISTPLFRSPRDRTPVDELRVAGATNFNFAQSCDDPTAAAHRRAQPVEIVPTREYAYEESDPIVLAREGDWFRIRTCAGARWVHAPEKERFYSYETLVRDGMSFFTPSWNGRFYATPGGMALETPTLDWDAAASVVRFSRVGGELWAYVLAGHEHCNPDAPQSPTIEGWVRAYGAERTPALWFHSRGC